MSGVSLAISIMDQAIYRNVSKAEMQHGPSRLRWQNETRPAPRCRARVMATCQEPLSSMRRRLTLIASHWDSSWS